MKSGHLDKLLRQAGTAAPPVDEVPEFTRGVLSELQSGGNPWARDWRRFLMCWLPVGLVLIVLLALAVMSLPHGDHDQAAGPAVFPEEQR